VTNLQISKKVIDFMIGMPRPTSPERCDIPGLHWGSTSLLLAWLPAEWELYGFPQCPTMYCGKLFKYASAVAFTSNFLGVSATSARAIRIYRKFLRVVLQSTHRNIFVLYGRGYAEWP
jgi:hypothetical protein